MTLQEIKHLFYAYRNGVVADTLRRSGMPYRIIFGLDLPTLTMIAHQAGYDNCLAEQLWNDKDVRESRLLAAYLYNPNSFDIEKAVRLATDVLTQEEADILTFKLFNKLSYKEKLSAILEESENSDMTRNAMKRWQS